MSFDGCCLADPTHHTSSQANASVTSKAMKIKNYPWSLWFLAFVLFSVDLWVLFSIVEGKLGEMLHGTQKEVFVLSCLVLCGFVLSCFALSVVLSGFVLSVLSGLAWSGVACCRIILYCLVLSCLVLTSDVLL
jgi:hypothetical protein